MTHSTPLAQLNALIDTALSATGQLSVVLAHENQALIDRQFELLEDLSAQKLALLTQLDDLHTQLDVLAAQVRQDQGYDRTGPILDDLGLSGDLSQWPTLKTMLGQTQHQNEVNGLLLEKTLAKVKLQIKLLRPAEQPSYGQGNTPTQASSGSVISKA